MTPERWQQVKDICYAALDHEAAERGAVLDALCAGDPQLRRDVEIMIADACSEESGLAAHAPAPQGAAAMARQVAAVGGAAEWIPDVIGSFRIRRVVGQGGMGVVYEAEQQEPHRTVALKVIRPGLATPELLRRFRQEAQALGRLQHPGIAQIYEAGTAETPFGPQPYFAMEFIRGESLRAYMERRRPTVPERLALIERIADAVHHAHQRGLIHRDLKPSNILIDESGQPKVLDFGVARLTDSDVHVSQQTDLGQLIGTLAYMSPEQVLADPAELDTRSDVYALGVMLYELLAGRLPYDVSTSIHEAIRTIHEEDPKRLSSISRIYRGDLETIAAKALEKDKSRRYGSAAALAADIRRYLQNEPISARPASASYQLQKFARRHRAVVAAVAAVMLALAVGIVATTREALRARRAERAAVTSEETAQAITNFLQNDLLAQAGATAQAAPGTKPDPDLKVRTALDRAAGRIDGTFAGRPVVEAAIRATIGRTYYDIGLFPQATEQFTKALELRKTALGPTDRSTLSSISELSTLYSATGDWSRAESHASALVHMCPGALGEQHDDCISARAQLAQIYSDQGKFAQAEPQLASIVALQRQTLGDRHDDTLTSMNDLALCYRRQRKDAQAEQLYRETLDLRMRFSGEEHPQTLLVMNNLGGLYLAQSRFTEAEAMLGKLVATSRRALGEEHRTTLFASNGLALAYTNLGRLTEAEALQRRVVEVQGRVLGENHPATLAALNNLSQTQWRQGRFAEAATLQTQLLETRRKLLGVEHPDTITSEQNLARVHRSLGQFDSAQELVASVLTKRQRVLRPDNPQILTALLDQGALFRLQGDYSRAEAVLTQAVEQLRRALGPKDLQTLNGEENLAEVFRLQRRLPEAEALLNSVLQARQRDGAAENAATSATRVALGRVLIDQRKHDQAMPHLRAALQHYERNAPDSWRRFQCMSLLGSSVVQAGQWQEAEQLLVPAFEGMHRLRATMPVEERSTLETTRRALVELYKGRQPEKAAGWARRAILR